MNQRLLLALPHRQFVFAFPKLLRPYFRHNRRLFSQISRLIFAILQEFYDKAAKRPVRAGMILAYQASSEFCDGIHTFIASSWRADLMSAATLSISPSGISSECRSTSAEW
jgi:hypothetical protein